MAFTPIDQMMGIQPIGVISTTQNHPLGKILRADDPVYGEGEFIYLLGVVGTVPGSLVNWGGITGSGAAGVPQYQTALCPSTAGLACPVAFAVAANVAANYGWYQIGGVAVAACTTMAGAGVVGIHTAAGSISSTLVAGKQIVNCNSLVAVGTPAAGLTLVNCSRPFAQGAIT